MSKAEKIVRLIVIFIAMLLITVSFNLIMTELNIENKSTLIFVHLAFPSALGLICGNSINNTLCLPDETGKEKNKDEKDRNKEI